MGHPADRLGLPLTCAARTRGRRSESRIEYSSKAIGQSWMLITRQRVANRINSAEVSRETSPTVIR